MGPPSSPPRSACQTSQPGNVYGIQGTAPMANGIPRRERRLAGASSARWLARRGKKVKYLITSAGCCGFRAKKEDCGTKPKLTAIHGFDLRPSPRARTRASPFFFFLKSGYKKGILNSLSSVGGGGEVAIYCTGVAWSKKERGGEGRRMEVKEEKSFFLAPLILLTFSEDDSMSLGRGGGERGRRERRKVRGEKEKERTTFSLSTQPNLGEREKS